MDPPDRHFVAGNLAWTRTARRYRRIRASADAFSSAMRPSAARGSPCPPVAMISTSPRGSFIAVSKSTVSGKSRR
jgi:hypothetical protein